MIGVFVCFKEHSLSCEMTQQFVFFKERSLSCEIRQMFACCFFQERSLSCEMTQLVSLSLDCALHGVSVVRGQFLFISSLLS